MSGNELFAAAPYRVTAIHLRYDAEVGVGAVLGAMATRPVLLRAI
jgi:hypothetical protein